MLLFGLFGASLSGTITRYELCTRTREHQRTKRRARSYHVSWPDSPLTLPKFFETVYRVYDLRFRSSVHR